jgi:hypothetical protein
MHGRISAESRSRHDRRSHLGGNGAATATPETSMRSAAALRRQEVEAVVALVDELPAARPGARAESRHRRRSQVGRNGAATATPETSIWSAAAPRRRELEAVVALVERLQQRGRVHERISAESRSRHSRRSHLGANGAATATPETSMRSAAALRRREVEAVVALVDEHP